MSSRESAKLAEITKPGLVLSLDEDADIAEGQEVILDCGLGVVVAPANTQNFHKAAASAVRKFGGRGASSLSDLRPKKHAAAMAWIAANATFLRFFDPSTGRSEFSVRNKKSGEVEKITGNTLENRIRILLSYPLIRKQINDAVDEVTDDLDEETEDTSGN